MGAGAKGRLPRRRRWGTATSARGRRILNGAGVSRARARALAEGRRHMHRTAMPTTMPTLARSSSAPRGRSAPALAASPVLAPGLAPGLALALVFAPGPGPGPILGRVTPTLPPPPRRPPLRWSHTVRDPSPGAPCGCPPGDTEDTPVSLRHSHPPPLLAPAAPGARPPPLHWHRHRHRHRHRPLPLPLPFLEAGRLPKKGRTSPPPSSPRPMTPPGRRRRWQRFPSCWYPPDSPRTFPPRAEPPSSAL